MLKCIIPLFCCFEKVHGYQNSNKRVKAQIKGLFKVLMYDVKAIEQ